RVLVAAVLGPHQREQRELDPVRLAAEQLDDPVVLRVGQAQLAVRRRGHARAHAGTGSRASEANSLPPSVEPVSGAKACSGWGLRPSTFPPALVTPAMSRSAPFGFCAGA